MSTEDDMWQDYDHYMHTGELSEYFEEECEEEEYFRDNSGDGITDAYCKDLEVVTKLKSTYAPIPYIIILALMVLILIAIFI